MTSQVTFDKDFTNRSWKFTLTPTDINQNHYFEGQEEAHWNVLVYYGDKQNDGLAFISIQSVDKGLGQPFMNLTSFDLSLGLLFKTLVPRQGKLFQVFGKSITVTVELQDDAATSTVYVVCYKSDKQQDRFRPFDITVRVQADTNTYPLDFATHVCLLPSTDVEQFSFRFYDKDTNVIFDTLYASGNQNWLGIYIPLPPEALYILETNSFNWYASYRIFG